MSEWERIANVTARQYLERNDLFKNYVNGLHKVIIMDPIANAAVQIAGNKFTCVGCDATNLTPNQWAEHLFKHKIFSYVWDKESKLRFVCCCGHTDKEALEICRHILSFPDLAEHVAPYLTLKALAEM